MKNKKYIVLIFFVLLILVPDLIARADAGPGPSTIKFVFENAEGVELKEFRVCETRKCDEYEIFQPEEYPEYYKMGIRWDENTLQIMGASSSTGYYQLVLVKSEEILTSDIFFVNAYSAVCTVSLKDNEIEIVEQRVGVMKAAGPWLLLLFIPAAFITLISEAIAIFLYSKKVKRKIRFLTFANLISLPILWFYIPYYLHLQFESLFIIGEIIVILFEGFFLYVTNQKEKLELSFSMKASLIVNLTSIITAAVIVGILFLFI